MTDNIDVTINNLYLYVPNLIPSVEAQVMFNEVTQNNYKISYDEWFTERRIISDTITQLDIGSSQDVQKPKYLMVPTKRKIELMVPYQLKMSLYSIILIFQILY